ncbi:MAG: tetratricopeptide repeat protein [Calditrichaeota bacterium]|nr:MAG: tetratricopeptide repeat protein [Calditrichota bacterium]
MFCISFPGGDRKMFEMLGNQFFLVRNYPRAAVMLEKALLRDPQNKLIRRKLIICYTQIGEVQKAFDIFLSLIKEDVDFIINTDPVDDDCPCPELVYNMESRIPENLSSLDFHLVAGMLWLYCDLHRSIEFFRSAHELAPSNPRIKAALAILENRSRKSSPSSEKMQ